MTRTRTIVIGAGVGGYTAAIALRARGIDVEIYEAAPEQRTTGSGINVGSNGTAVLRNLGIELGTPLPGQALEQLEIRTHTGRSVRQLPLGSMSRALGAPTIGISRNDLISLLRTAAGDCRVHFGAELSRFEVGGSAATAFFADGRSATADVLIGADGIRSAVRSQLAQTNPLIEYGYVCWSAAIPFTHPRLPSGLAAQYWGSGKRFDLVDIGGGNAYWWGTERLGIEAARTARGDQRTLLHAFDGWADEVLDAISHTPDSVIGAVPAQDRPLLQQWGSGPVTLLGDAAHPMLNSLGQASGAAIEDAWVLAQTLASTPDVSNALRRYEQNRMARTLTMVRNARRRDRIEQLGNPLGCRMRTFALRYSPTTVLARPTLHAMRFEPSPTP